MSVKAKCDDCGRLIDVRAMWKHRERCGSGSATVRAASRRSARRSPEGTTADTMYAVMEAEIERLDAEIMERQDRRNAIRTALDTLKG